MQPSEEVDEIGGGLPPRVEEESVMHPLGTAAGELGHHRPPINLKTIPITTVVWAVPAGRVEVVLLCFDCLWKLRTREIDPDEVPLRAARPWKN